MRASNPLLRGRICPARRWGRPGWSGIGIIFLIALLATSTHAQNTAGGKPRIIVIKTRDLPFYKPAVDGFLNGLKARGYRNKETVDIKVVALNGKSEEDSKLIREQIGEKPALLITLGTDATRLVAEQKPAIPTLFSMILDPVSLGLVKSLEEPGGNFTGTTLLVSPGKQLDALLQTVPKAHRIGVLYTDKDSTSLAFLAEANQEAKRLNIEIHSVAVPADQESSASALKSLKDSDALWLIPDPASTGPQALTETFAFAKGQHLPVLGASSATVRAGALLALSANLEDVGDATAEMAAHLLDKTETPARMHVRGPRRTTLSVNLIVARALSLQVPQTVLHLADEVIDSDMEDK